MEKYLFFHRDGGYCKQAVDLSQPETWLYLREEITEVYSNCTERFLFSEKNVVQNPTKSWNVGWLVFFNPSFIFFALFHIYWKDKNKQMKILTSTIGIYLELYGFAIIRYHFSFST